MANFNLPHTFHDGVGEAASGAQVMEDLEKLKERIELLEALELKLNGVLLPSASEIKTYTSEPAIGPTAGTTYNETGIAFATACLDVWLGGWTLFGDAGHTGLAGGQPFGVKVTPNGKNVNVEVQNGSGVTIYPRIAIVALGH